MNCHFVSSTEPFVDGFLNFTCTGTTDSYTNSITSCASRSPIEQPNSPLSVFSNESSVSDTPILPSLGSTSSNGSNGSNGSNSSNSSSLNPNVEDCLSPWKFKVSCMTPLLATPLSKQEQRQEKNHSDSDTNTSTCTHRDVRTYSNYNVQSWPVRLTRKNAKAKFKVRSNAKATANSKAKTSAKIKVRKIKSSKRRKRKVKEHIMTKPPPSPSSTPRCCCCCCCKRHANDLNNSRIHPRRPAAGRAPAPYKKKWPCKNNTCGKLFSSKFSAERHYLRVHATLDEKEEAKRFECPARRCPARFDDMYSVNRHVRSLHKDL